MSDIQEPFERNVSDTAQEPPEGEEPEEALFKFAGQAGDEAPERTAREPWEEAAAEPMEAAAEVSEPVPPTPEPILPSPEPPPVPRKRHRRGAWRPSPATPPGVA